MNNSENIKMPSEDIWPKIIEIADKYKSAISSAILLGFVKYRKGIDKKALSLSISNKNMDEILKIIDMNPKQFKDFNKISKKLAKEVSKTIISEYNINIDIKNLSIQKYIDEYVADLVVQVSDITKKAIKHTIKEGWDNEILPKTIAKNITEEIGLDKRRMNSLKRYEHQLIKDKELHAKFPNKNDWLNEIHKLKMIKFNELLHDRAMTITRTECINLANEGSRKTYEEMAKNNPIIRDDYELCWIVTPDDRLCHHCATMKNQRCSFSGKFTFIKYNSEGEEIKREFLKRPTLHPRCRCIIVCMRKIS